jgi:hypothetical protein
MMPKFLKTENDISLQAKNLAEEINSSLFHSKDAALLQQSLLTTEAQYISMLAADWACYPKPQDQAETPRFLSVTAAFPEGFKLYCLPSNGRLLPVGYTGWYPIEKSVFEILHNTPEHLTHRGAMKPQPLSRDENYIYLFNYSVIQSLRRTPVSARLVKLYAAEILGIPRLKGIAAVTVSEDGQRVARKFGMELRGDMTHDGDIEPVYTIKID